MSLDLRILLTAADMGASALINKVDGSMGSLVNRASQVGAVMTGIGAAITGTMGASLTSAAAYGDEIAKASDRSGIAAEELSRLRYAAEQSDVEFGKLSGSLARMQRNAYEASQGSAEQAEAFAALGLSAEDVQEQMGSAEGLFLTLSQRLADVENETERAALAQLVFGRGGVALLPMLQDGAEGIKALGDRAQELGIVWSGEASASAERYNDALNDVKLATRGLGQTLVTTLGPSISAIAEDTAEAIGSFREWAAENPGLAKGLIGVAGGLGLVMGTVGPILYVLPQLQAGLTIVTGLFRAKGTAATVAGAEEVAASERAVVALDSEAAAAERAAGAYQAKGSAAADAGAAGAAGGVTGGGAVGIGVVIGTTILAGLKAGQVALRARDFRSDMDQLTDPQERAVRRLEELRWLESDPASQFLMGGRRREQLREQLDIESLTAYGITNQQALAVEDWSANQARNRRVGEALQRRGVDVNVNVTGSPEMMRELLRSPEGRRAFEDQMRQTGLSAGWAP